MLTLTLLAVAPRAAEWTPTIGIIMILSNIAAIAFAKLTAKNPGGGPSLPSSELFGGFGLGGLLGSTAFGHVLGAGVILGLSNLGVI
ncbi:photosystem I reaction center subunit PsaK [Kovacikia minuta CCNUW1]|uniref:photosystem I reaction center subunit PsaK n=1 Tax=Kovacikia minuta TaxID=2931930 RepID=UPI001CCD9BD8|nr:photosystem I reaction center subunit PsaK [Kovacikia minuta]UBF25138.1 photosystem I reaction center subunit PsaK [Kovacikia minuta CCNUW1]